MPSPAKKSRSTGPKTAQGKAKSSQNAVSHGLTSSRVMPDEIRMVEDFTQELIQYYQPQSPLEVLQIQRIAFCRAKLAKLMDMEVAGRELARRQIDLAPELVMDRMVQFQPRLKSMALDSIKGESVLAQLGLDERTWLAIVQDIQHFSGQLEDESDLASSFPKLCGYLSEAKLVQGQIDDLALDRSLRVFAEKIRDLNSHHESRAHAHSLANGQKLTVEDLINAVDKIKTAEQMASSKGVRIRLEGESGYQRAVDVDLKEILQLASLLEQVPKVMQGFEEMKDWMLRSADLQSEESEKMMKYQTMIERRLSSAIGELLELRKLRIN